MSLATSSAPRRHSRAWYVAVFSLAGGIHWYSVYAHGLSSSVAPAMLHYPAEQEPAKPKTEKPSSGDKSGGSAKATSDGQADAPDKVSNHKPAARPTSTPGA